MCSLPDLFNEVHIFSKCVQASVALGSTRVYQIMYRTGSSRLNTRGFTSRNGYGPSPSVAAIIKNVKKSKYILKVKNIASAHGILYLCYSFVHRNNVIYWINGEKVTNKD